MEAQVSRSLRVKAFQPNTSTFSGLIKEKDAVWLWKMVQLDLLRLVAKGSERADGTVGFSASSPVQVVT